VPDCEQPEYWSRMDRLIELNTQLLAIGQSDAPEFVQKLQQAPIIERMVANIFQIFIMKPRDVGSVDINEPAIAY
jgi:magnesium-protoporphyrin IX monomethyl ester (oxidative) cyclase